MRFLLTFCLFLGVFTQASGQGGLDTLGLTGTVADTVVANKFYEAMRQFIKEKKWESAESYGEKAIFVFRQTLGEESKQLGNVWYQKGRIRFLNNEYQKAIECLNKALKIRLSILGNEHPDIATTYNLIGVVYEKNGEYEKSIESHKNALSIRLKILGDLHPDVAYSYNNLGNSSESLGRFEDAISYHEKALHIRIKNFGVENADVAWSYGNLGIVYQDKGEYNKAIEFYEKALKIRQTLYREENFDIASSYNNLGNTYQSKGEYDKACLYFEKTIKILENVLGDKHPYLFGVTYNLGLSYYYKGDFDKAQEIEIDVLKHRLNQLGQNHPDISDSYNVLGMICSDKGEYENSIDYYKKSLQVRTENFGFENLNVAESFNNIGNIYALEGQYKKALDYSKKALQIRREILGESHPTTSDSYNNIGDILLQSKENGEDPVYYFTKSLDARLKTFGTEHPDIASSYENLGIAYRAKGDEQKAIEYKKNALNIRLRLLNASHPDIANSYYNLGNSYISIGELDTAIQYYNDALNSLGYKEYDFSKISSISGLLNSLSELSNSYESQYNLSHEHSKISQSYSYILQTVATLKYQQTSLTESAKSFWQTQNYPIYEQAISVSLLKADVDHNDTLRQNTFSYAEKSKASLLQAQIKAADAINFSGIPDSLLQKEHNLRIDITWREKQRQGLLDKGLTETDTNTLRISSIIFDLKQQYDALKKRFETEYPEYYRLKYDLSTVSLAYVQDTLLQKDQALLEYFTGDSSLFLFVVRPDTFLVQEVKRDFPLETWIDSLRFGLYGYYTADKGLRTDSLRLAALNSYTRHAQLLQEKLIAPVAAWLPEKVILVPDGPLGYIPFDALLTGAPEDPNNFKSYPYLLEQHQFSYTYSATLLREMRDKKHRQEPEKDFAAFAPFYNGDTTLLTGMYAYDELMRKDLQPLAFSGPEVAAAAKLMKGETIAGSAATEERFTSTAGNYRILHLATHGRADNRVGDYAFLAFTEIKDSIENELLYVKDLYNLQLNADLVVLSACETGIGKLQRGEGIISLARAFAYAGAKSIVTSLWSVNDKSTSELMRFFYRELRRGKDKDEALRLARQRLLRESNVRNAHPFFWAAFVPLGDMRGVR